MKNKIAISLALVVMLTCCDWVNKLVCEKPTGKRKDFIANLNKWHVDKLTVQQVPCYPGYLQINCKTTVSDQLLNEIEFAAASLNYYEVLVYNKDNKLIRGNTGSM